MNWPTFKKKRGRKNDRSEPVNDSSETSPDERGDSLDSTRWLRRLPPQTTIHVLKRGAYIAALESDAVQDDAFPLEELLLRRLGPGTYRLVPKLGDRLDTDRAHKVTVGDVDLTLAPTPQSEVEALKDEVRELKVALESAGRPSTMSEVAEILKVVAPIFQPPSSSGFQERLLEKLVETSLKGPQEDTLSRKVVEQVLFTKADPLDQFERFEKLRATMAKNEASPGGLEQLLMAIPTLLPQAKEWGRKLFGGEEPAPALGHAPEGAYSGFVETPSPTPIATELAARPKRPKASPTEAAPEAHQRADIFKFVFERWRNKLRKLAQKGDTDALVEHLWTGWETAQEYGVQNEALEHFEENPGGVFDLVADDVPMSESVRREVREKLLERASETFGRDYEDVSEDEEDESEG